jgi:predicted RNase H-like nuclease (RuvC/YqgF family)
MENLSGNLRAVIESQETTLTALTEEISTLERALDDRRRQTTGLAAKLTQMRAVLDSLTVTQ